MPSEVIQSDVRACTIYDLESNLIALSGTYDSNDDPESRNAILDEIGQAVKVARDKRDHAVAFLRHCAQQQQFADEEIARIEDRKRHIARVQNELEAYLVRIVDQFATPDRRGVKRLDGNVSSLRIQKNPDSVLITDPNLVPAMYKDAVLTLPAYVWEALLGCLSEEERAEFERLVKRTEFRPDKKALAAELKTGEEIPGADWQFGQMRLVLS
jgi:hypothetical protein